MNQAFTHTRPSSIRDDCVSSVRLRVSLLTSCGALAAFSAVVHGWSMTNSHYLH